MEKIEGELNAVQQAEIHKQCKKMGMIPVSNLPNEDLRLAELNRLGILEKDLNQDPRYSSLTEITAHLMETPLCAINILGSTFQRCKMIYGLSEEEEEDFEIDEPRDLSICQFSLSNPHQPLVIENLLEDERTRNKYLHPESSSLRFYTGAPLMSSRGFSLGTLCVVDDKPRSVKHSQIEGLRLLADQIVYLIENQYEEEQEEISPTAEEKPAQAVGQYYSAATILFADMVGFTSKVERLDPGELLQTLDTFFQGFDQIVNKHQIHKVKTIGDAYMCVGGVFQKTKSHAKKVCSAGLDMLQFVDAINLQREIHGKERWDIRIGIHSGPLIAGTSGNSFDVWGDAVNIAARLESSSEPGKIQISEKTRDYLEGDGELTDRGQINLKGKGSFKTFFLESLNK